MILVRRLLGDVLRELRQEQGRTLRDVSADARVSLGYISEIERGQKEASSECLAAICQALDVPLSVIMQKVSGEIACCWPTPDLLQSHTPSGKTARTRSSCLAVRTTGK